MTTISRETIAENFPLSKADAMVYAQQTMSSRAFYRIVLDAVSNHDSLSVVRMGDGERTFLIDAAHAVANRNPGAIVSDPNLERVTRLGVKDMPVLDLARMLKLSAETADFFGPNINGLHMPTYSVYPWVKQWNLKTQPFFGALLFFAAA